MIDPEISEKMRAEWNARAQEDAGYYVSFGGRKQTEAEFFATAADVVRGIGIELRRFPPGTDRRTLKALEIGCGPGRLMRPLSLNFGEIHGVDVSDEMIRMARENLSRIGHAHPHHTDGASLALFADETFDFVYSYAVFQHIPSRDVVFQYLDETQRVLKTGGYFRAQFNGLPQDVAGYDTWNGARFSAGELMDFAREHDFQVLALDGAQTQYMWMTWRKRPKGWFEGLAGRAPEGRIHIRRITNSNSSEPVAPSRGRFAAISLWVEGLPEDCGLHHLQVTIGSSQGTVTYVGPADASGLRQVSVILPPLEATGLLPVEVSWLGRPLAPPAPLRVIPPPPVVPKIVSISDGVNLIAGTKIRTRSVKLVLEEVDHPEDFLAAVDGEPVLDVEIFCTDPRPQKFEVNFHLPETIEAGTHTLEIRLGRRKFAPVALEVAAE